MGFIIVVKFGGINMKILENSGYDRNYENHSLSWFLKLRSTSLRRSNFGQTFKEKSMHKEMSRKQHGMLLLSISGWQFHALCHWSTITTNLWMAFYHFGSVILRDYSTLQRQKIPILILGLVRSSIFLLNLIFGFFAKSLFSTSWELQFLIVTVYSGFFFVNKN